MERGQRVLRALPLWSEALGLSGRADIVEVSANGTFAPVEYKIGVQHGETAHVQMCAQALCLEEMMGVEVPVGHVWLSASRRRLKVPLDDRLRSQTIQAIAEVREWMMADRLPPAVHDARCGQCQFHDQCLPEVSARPESVQAYLREVVGCGF